jgi:hypothetical protein
MNRKIDRLYSLGKLIYWKTPHFLHFIYYPVENIIKMGRCLRLDRWRLSGTESSSLQELVIQYTGISENKNYLSALAFCPGYREEYLGRYWIWQALRDLPSTDSGISLNIVEVHEFFRKIFQKKGCFHVPSWLVGEIEIPDDISAFIRQQKNLRYNVQKAARHQFYPEVTAETSRIQRFYYDMHIPYITKTHNNKAVVVDFNTLKSKVRKCDLMLIKKDGEDIAGGLVAYNHNKASCVILGVKDGNLDYVRNGALYALYYHTFNHLRSKGYRSVNMGTSRAFLKDGALSYKKMWNFRIVGDSRTSLVMQIVNLTVGARGFLLNNPFISENDSGYTSSVFSGPEYISPEHMQKIFHSCYVNGVSGVRIYRLTEENSGNGITVPSELSGKLTISSLSDLT